jgi:endonuclease G
MNVRRGSVVLLLCFLSLAPFAHAASDVVISQVYGGGGNAGATYKNDFIELYNRGTVAVPLTGWSVQYASSTGSSWQVTPLSGSIGPGQYYLVQEAAGTGGTVSLPLPVNASGSIPLAAGAGKVALVASTAPLSGTCPAAVDFVGFGAANCFEGTGPTATLTNTTAALRAGSGCTDSDRNSADFATGAPAPRNSATTPHLCDSTPPPVPNNPPTISAFANPVTTVDQDAAPFQVSLSGLDDKAVYTWSAIAGAGVSNAAVSGGQGTANVTYTVTLQPGFSGTATFTASLSDGVNPAVTAAVTVNVSSAPPPPLDHIVISQVYGGGGNSGATFNRDFVELYNPTTSTVDLGGWTIQYASATGTSTWQTQPLGGIMQAGEYYLIALASGAVGADLPSANISGELNMSGTNGKVALSRTGDPLNACPVGDPALVDLVGYGTTANCREGATNAPTASNSTALFRKNGGFTDTNVNGADFQTGTPNPRRTTPIQEIGPAVLSSDPRNNFSNAPRDASITVTFNELVEVSGPWYHIACATTGVHDDATVAASDNNWIITPNVNFLAGEQCTVTVFRQFVHDADLDDSGPNADTMASDYVFTFSVATGTAPAYPADVHLTFGNPSGATADLLTPDNYLMVKPELALSYNRSHGTPNWVSWHLADEWIGSLARVDTFRPDPAVPAEWYRVLHTDYFGSGFDRGHMTPNADRDPETSSPINQATFLMSNMVPQAPDNNQGPWAAMESYLRTLLPANELYIVSGPAGVGGTGSSGFMTTFANGHVTVPASTWKVAIVLPKQSGDDVARVTAGTRTIAVILPNTQGIRNVDWTSYLTTVDAVEALTGYDFFANVPDAIENAIEAGVNGVNPPGVVDQSISISEDGSRTFALNAVSGSDAALTYTVSTPAHGTLSGSGANRTYTPAPDFFGDDRFTFTASDGTRTSNTGTVTITVSAVNDAPTANDDAKSTNEDTPLQFSAAELTANDLAGPADESGQALSVTSVSAAAGTVSLLGGIVTYVPAANFNGAASFSYTVCDNGISGGLTSAQCVTGVVHVDVVAVNDAPVVSLTAPGAGVEGGALAGSVTVSDDDAGDNASIAWTVTKNGAPFASGNGAAVGFTPDDDGSYVVNVIVTDGAGATGSASATVVVANVAPVISGTTGPNAQLALGTAAAVSVSYSDAGADTHSATFAWGDGTTSVVACAAGVCSSSRTYTAGGVYGVTVTVSDDDGGVASSTFGNVVVYDNNGGFVTGGGWYSTAAGKAHVNVDAKYNKKAAVPSGKTKVELAGASFDSTSYDWLVVNGNTAQYQGAGTFNGAAVGFNVTVTDGGAADTFRLRVWNTVTGAGVYDTGSVAVEGGNVTVH